MRPFPDFLIIGVKRGGTTSMYRYLLRHPLVLPLFPSARRLPLRADRKGVHFFDERYTAGPNWYRSNFATSAARALASRSGGGRACTGEATPYYLHHPLAAERAADVVPGVRIIVLLRDPVERAHSHYKEQRRRGFEPLPSFEEAVDAEPGRLAGEAERLLRDPSARSFAHEHQSYVDQGRYLPDLERWFQFHSPDRISVVCSEDFYRDPQGIYDGVTDFLELPRFDLGGPKPFNPTEPAPIPEALRRRLAEQYAPDITALEDRVGRKFSWGSP